MSDIIALDKIIRVGKTPDGNLFAKIVFRDGRLSITGVVGPMQNGDCKGSCGQIVMGTWDVHEYARGWDAETVETFRAIWQKWHLNDMCAGSPAQTQYLDSLRSCGVNVGDYDNQVALLKLAGIYFDYDYTHNGQPYQYGSAWLTVDVPQDVLEWLSDLPETDIVPEWV